MNSCRTQEFTAEGANPSQQERQPLPAAAADGSSCVSRANGIALLHQEYDFDPDRCRCPEQHEPQFLLVR
jgi:hypothetical protein